MVGSFELFTLAGAMLSNPIGERLSTVGVAAVGERFEVVENNAVSGAVVFGALGAGQEYEFPVRQNIDAGPAV